MGVTDSVALWYEAGYADWKKACADPAHFVDMTICEFGYAYEYARWVGMVWRRICWRRGVAVRGTL